MAQQPQYQQELVDFENTQLQQNNQKTRDDTMRKVAALARTTFKDGDKIVESKNAGNRILLLAGTYGTTLLEQTNTWIQACPGTTINNLWTVKGGQVRITGIDFTQPIQLPKNSTISPLVILEVTALPVYFIDCTFTMASAANVIYVQVKDGAKAIFSNCTFVGTQTAGAPISNAGATANVAIIGGANLTGRPHINVTTIQEF